MQHSETSRSHAPVTPLLPARVVIKIQDGKTKFGMFEGVFARCLLNIWGVIMFLRMGWMVGQAGAWEATSIVIVAMTVTVITTLSLSAICTNGTVKSGGAYYLISRTLGPQFGGAIGILFRWVDDFLATSMRASFPI